MDKGEPGDPEELARTYDAFFEAAEQERYARYGEHAERLREVMTRHKPYRLGEFVEAYRAGGIYPADRLGAVLSRFTDVRLALAYAEIDLGLINELYYLPIHLDATRADSADLKLKKMAVDQSLIMRPRTAWEKLMLAVYCLETGKPEIPRTNARSVKSTFFTWVATTDKWRFLEPYTPVVTEHDERLRTPEFHKNSVLRGRMLGRETASFDQIVTLMTYMLNGIWPNILQILRGERPGTSATCTRSRPRTRESTRATCHRPTTRPARRRPAGSSCPGRQARRSAGCKTRGFPVWGLYRIV
jgi:hypothetical protein